MSKELEALEDIRKKLAKHYDIEDIYKWDAIEDDLEIIETALKRLEEKEHNCEVNLKQMNALVSKLSKYQKEHKALKIIKEKGMFVSDNAGICTNKRDIRYSLEINYFNQEEIDLLKEVLL